MQENKRPIFWETITHEDTWPAVCVLGLLGLSTIYGFAVLGVGVLLINVISIALPSLTMRGRIWLLAGTWAACALGAHAWLVESPKQRDTQTQIETTLETSH